MQTLQKTPLSREMKVAYAEDNIPAAIGDDDAKSFYFTYIKYSP